MSDVNSPSPAPVVLDAPALKAFAHPLRIRLYELLDEHGPATSAQLSARVGESRGSTSYHLRQLARHGLLEELPDRGTAKERWWRATPGGYSFNGDLFRRRADTADAAEVLIGEFLRQRTDELSRWARESRTMPQEWVQASVNDRTTLSLTRTELAQLVQDVLGVFRRHRTRVGTHDDTSTDPVDTDGRARVVLHFDALPWASPSQPQD